MHVNGKRVKQIIKPPGEVAFKRISEVKSTEMLTVTPDLFVLHYLDFHI